MQCPRCRQHYSTDGDLQPRIIITCGHSFCRKCVKVLRNDAGIITCPQCGQLSGEADAPNIALMSYIAVQSQRSDSSKIRDVPAPRHSVTCQHCNVEEVKFICYQCLPAGFRFCFKCCEIEHDRSFGPVKQHKPIPIEQAKYGALIPDCMIHPNQSCELFSFTENRFACEKCTQEPDYQNVNFVDIQIAVDQVRDSIPPLVTKVTAIRDRLQAIQSKLNEQLGRIDQAKSTAVDKVRLEFQDFEMALRKRQAYVESLVEETASYQKKHLNEQMERVEVALGSITTSLIQANILNQMQDYSLLLKSTDAVGLMKKQIVDQVADDLNEPSTSMGILIYISPEFRNTIDNLGMVGGGIAPSNFSCNNEHGMILLTWKIPEREVLEYEIMCDLVLNDPDNFNPVMTNQAFPRHFLVKAKVCQKRIDNLFPEMRYRFRIRSRDNSGWGWWSASILGSTPGFPLEIGYTGEIIKIPLPSNGLYRIVAHGAKAADGEKKKGGKGAIIDAQFVLEKNDFLEILIGGMSEKRGPCSGGGGGTFVGLNGRQDLLIAAGGGGGTRGYDDEDLDGKDASIDLYGLGGHGGQWAAGGNSGRAGRDAVANGPCWGYGGAGHVENSTTATSFVAGGTKGDGGGFGGGGGIGSYGGGGGGGYSGGGGGRGGGGGGSYIREDGLNIIRSVGNEGNGFVSIDKLKDEVTENDLITL